MWIASLFNQFGHQHHNNQHRTNCSIYCYAYGIYIARELYFRTVSKCRGLDSRPHCFRFARIVRERSQRITITAYIIALRKPFFQHGLFIIFLMDGFVFPILLLVIILLSSSRQKGELNKKGKRGKEGREREREKKNRRKKWDKKMHVVKRSGLKGVTRHRSPQRHRSVNFLKLSTRLFSKRREAKKYLRTTVNRFLGVEASWIEPPSL